VFGLIIALLLAGQDVSANDVPRYSLEKKARLSDVVVAGHVLSVGTESPDRGGWPTARVRVDAVLKGTPGEEVEVMTRVGISELDLDCCEIGKSYLFFLVKAKNGRFMSVNGPHGVYPLAAR
jgi:hypothetical protein